MRYSEEVLWSQLEDVRGYTVGVCKTLAPDLVQIVPKGFNNSILWNVGHIVYDQDVWFHYLIADEAEVPAEYGEFFGFGTSPGTWTNEPPSWEELVDRLISQPVILKRKFSGRLEEPLQRVSELGMSTIGEVIPRTLYHEWYHLGFVQSIRKILSADH
ncbi:DinB family protein [Paenibacillus jiagnxiensis]|uniref:DinB family protein n=1 Tax=Paenibacillus jiagnxiensis TaxID=3228926 RepID=UPI00339F2F21